MRKTLRIGIRALCKSLRADDVWADIARDTDGSVRLVAAFDTFEHKHFYTFEDLCAHVGIDADAYREEAARLLAIYEACAYDLDVYRDVAFRDLTVHEATAKWMRARELDWRLR